MSHLVAILQGGLGNQLFIYATAKNLALKSGVELILDDKTGFLCDKKYRREYRLNHLEIRERTTTDLGLRPISSLRRRVRRRFKKSMLFGTDYIFQNEMSFDQSILNISIERPTYLDGYWQSYHYFDQIKNLIKKDTEYKGCLSGYEKSLIKKVKLKKSVAIHFRFFDSPKQNMGNNIPLDYYSQALQKLRERQNIDHVVIFAEDEHLIEKNSLFKDFDVDVVSGLKRTNSDVRDIQIMRNCHSFIIPNSTYSWWGAWLADSPGKVVIAPKLEKYWGASWWGFAGLLPDDWIRI